MISTKDRDEILAWAEPREAHAAQVVGKHDQASEDFEPEIGALRLGFLGYASEETTEPLMWDAFFEIFNERDLTFYYREVDDDGNPTNDYRIE